MHDVFGCVHQHENSEWDSNEFGGRPAHFQWVVQV
jgi:hypothetical protein